MVIWTLARKDLRVLLRDARAMVILLAMPFIFILVLGLSLGEGFGQKPDDRLRISIVDLDRGYAPAHAGQAAAFLAIPPSGPAGVGALAPLIAYDRNRTPDFPNERWADMVRRDLSQTGGIRVEIIEQREQGEQMVRSGKRSAVIVLGPRFSERVARCSFLADGINPFYREGVDLEALDAEILRDPTQLTAASIIEQVAQVSLLRVVLPWMIGQAFGKIGDPEFINRLRTEKALPANIRFAFNLLPEKERRALGQGVQNALQHLYPHYNLTAKTWAALTKSQPHEGPGEKATVYHDPSSGLLKRGTLRYQLLVPSYTVMFAFFLVLTVGWLFVAERREGTMKRLVAAPLSRTHILFGKLLPCLLVSLFQGFFLLGAGKLVFGMSWGTQPALLIPVVCSTSLAAMGLALLLASVARTETQVSIYGTLLVLVLAGLSGAMMGDRSLMPPAMQQISLITPHAWALDAYRQLLSNPQPELHIVFGACAVLTGFGVVFIVLAWACLKLE